MKLRHTMPWRAITAASLLTCALAIPGSTAAVPTDTGDLDAQQPRRDGMKGAGPLQGLDRAACSRPERQGPDAIHPTRHLGGGDTAEDVRRALADGR